MALVKPGRCLLASEASVGAPHMILLTPSTLHTHLR